MNGSLRFEIEQQWPLVFSDTIATLHIDYKPPQKLLHIPLVPVPLSFDLHLVFLLLPLLPLPLPVLFSLLFNLCLVLLHLA